MDRSESVVQLKHDRVAALAEQKRYCQQVILANMCYAGLPYLRGMKVVVEEQFEAELGEQRDYWVREQEKEIGQVSVELGEQHAGVY